MKAYKMHKVVITVDRGAASKTIAAIAAARCFHILPARDVDEESRRDARMRLATCDTVQRHIDELITLSSQHISNRLVDVENGVDDVGGVEDDNEIEGESVFDIDATQHHAVERISMRIETIYSTIKQQIAAYHQLIDDSSRYLCRSEALYWIAHDYTEEMLCGRSTIRRDLPRFAVLLAASFVVQPAITRAIFRVSHGNAAVTWRNRTGNKSLEPRIYLNVALCVCASEGILHRVERVALAMGAQYVEALDPNQAQNQSALEAHQTSKAALRVANSTLRHVRRLLHDSQSLLSEAQRILRVQRVISRIEAINCSVGPSTSTMQLIGWCPAHVRRRLRRAINGQSSSTRQSKIGESGRILIDIANDDGPARLAPSLFPTYSWLQPFQLLVDTFGVPRGDELNPAPLCAITFPFMFSIMFGDMGHAAILIGIGLVLIPYTKHSLRLLPLMLGIAALYTGALYDDAFGFSASLFASKWNSSSSSLMQRPEFPVVFGLDRAWHDSKHRLSFLNSYKMKLSIIIGVVHMTCGLAIHVYNDPNDFWISFVPRFFFFQCTFGYLGLLIVLKAATDWDGRDPPSIIDTFLRMFLGSFDDAPTLEPLHPAQDTIQRIFVLIAILSVPVMLFGNIFRHHWSDICSLVSRVAIWMRLQSTWTNNGDATTSRLNEYERVQSRVNDDEINSIDEEGLSGNGEGDNESRQLQSSYVTTVAIDSRQSPDPIIDFIHTIEFVLGAVSNTASYLRLWALSLAHQQLADVFLVNVLEPAISSDNWIINIIGFAVWLCATLGILCGMDSLECCLHALRLHWVEFFNKFYHGDGVAYDPVEIDPADLSRELPSFWELEEI